MAKIEKNEATKKRVVTSFEIGDLKSPWQKYCDKHSQGDSGKVLRAVIRKLAHVEIREFGLAEVELEPKLGRSEKLSTVEPVVEPKLKRGLEVRFTQSEREALKARADEDGFATSNLWIAALVRANLTEKPQFGKREIEALGESNHQLLAIGRNLNQIARALNAQRGNTTQYDAELVEELCAAVKRHVSKVGDLLRASLFRWKLR
jgi:hypothetical protein